jgi:hypothetical protein
VRPHPGDVISLFEVSGKMGTTNVSKNVQNDFFRSQQDHEKGFHGRRGSYPKIGGLNSLTAESDNQPGAKSFHVISVPQEIMAIGINELYQSRVRFWITCTIVP